MTTASRFEGATNYRAYTTMDRSTWLAASLAEGEPDKVQWIDDGSGLDCLIVRSHFGALCGFVGVDESHPWHGKDDSACTLGVHCGEPYCNHKPGVIIDVHGGLTYASLCDSDGDEARHICTSPHRAVRITCGGSASTARTMGTV